MSEVTSFMLRRRPDQTTYTINQLINKVDEMNSTVRILSKDKKSVIIIGEQPVNPATGKPYSFGIHTYKVLGDRLEEIS